MDSPALDFTIRFENRDGYLYAFVSGDEDSLERSLLYARQVAAECRVRSYQRVLVEESFKTQVSKAEMFRFAAEIPGIVGDIAVAFVDRHLEHHDLNILGLMIAVERGVKARIFQSVDDAEAWLLAATRE